MAQTREAVTIEPTLRQRELVARVVWFIQLRWLAVAGTFLALFFLWHLFDMRFPLRAALGTTVSILFYNVIFALVAKQLRARGVTSIGTMRLFANVQVVTDLLCLTLLIHFLGGVENYFVVFYFFHMVIASILLPKKNSYCLALVAALLLHGMIWGEYFGVVAHYPYETILGPCRIDSFEFNFVAAGILTVAIFLSVYFATTIANRLREREREIESSYRNLQRVDEEKGYFMRRASHELRSPLSAVQSLVHIFLEGLGGSITEEQRGLLLRMEVRLKALLSLVNDLLRFSRLRVLEKPQNVEPFDLGEIVRQAVDLMSPWAKEKGIQLELKCESARLYGEAEGFREVASNLISNGIKYTPAGGRVAVTLEKRASTIHLSVEDTGIGIRKEEQDRVFTEFFRARNAKEMTQEGTGLGLVITKRVVEIHGGSIRFDSGAGEGTRFEIDLPRMDGIPGLPHSAE